MLISGRTTAFYWESDNMRKTLICLFGLYLIAAPVAKAEKALDYFNLGVRSTRTIKKIKYFTKALDLNPEFAPAYEARGLLYFFQEKGRAGHSSASGIHSQ